MVRSRVIRRGSAALYTIPASADQETEGCWYIPQLSRLVAAKVLRKFRFLPYPIVPGQRKQRQGEFANPVSLTNRNFALKVRLPCRGLRPNAQQTLRFPEPHRFDIQRPRASNLAFGQGPHYCLGAGIGRLEMEVFFNAFLRRAPELRLATETIEYRECFNNRGLKELPVVW